MKYKPKIGSVWYTNWSNRPRCIVKLTNNKVRYSIKYGTEIYYYSAKLNNWRMLYKSD